MTAVFVTRQLIPIIKETDMDDENLVGVTSLTERQKLFNQFDYAAEFGTCSLVIHEAYRPGATEALLAWASAHGHEVIAASNDNGTDWLDVKLGDLHSITVFPLEHMERAA